MIAWLGAALIAIVAWEVFQDLFHPAESGALSGWIGRKLFDTLRRRSGLLPLSGPFTIVVVIATWVLLLALGFALLYNHWFPADFRTSTEAIPASASRFVTAFYFSFETLVTLGYGDLVPGSTSTRLLSAFEALIGLGVLTASLSLLMLLYPALARMRTLARTVANVVASELRTGTSIARSGSDAMLMTLARDVTRTRIDLVHFPIIYYFAAVDRNASIAYWTPQLVRWAEHDCDDRLGRGEMSRAG